MTAPRRSSIRRRIAAALPPLARRDQLLEKRARVIAKLQAQRAELNSKVSDLSRTNAELQAALANANEAQEALRSQVEDLAAQAGRSASQLPAQQKPSFQQMLTQQAQLAMRLRHMRQPGDHPLAQLPYKLRNIALAQSHGIAVPEVYDVWRDAAEIRLDRLPDQFVVKADGGANATGVFPLERTEPGVYAVIGGKRSFTESELRKHIIMLGRRARAPYFAEELLEPAQGGVLPDDIKIFACYGQVGHVMVRRMTEHARIETSRLGYFDAAGESLGSIEDGRSHDASIPAPEMLPELVSAASHLSRAVGLAFCRVDLYQTTKGVVFGEFTQIPTGGKVRFTPNHDATLGQAWLRALIELERDLNRGRPVGAHYGTHPAPTYYPPSEDAQDPANWSRTVVDCQNWCSSVALAHETIGIPAR